MAYIEVYEDDTLEMTIDGVETVRHKIIIDNASVNSIGHNQVGAIAGENISGSKAVMINSDGLAYVFNISDENNYGKVCGIAKEGVIVGESLNIYINGIVTKEGSGWTAGGRYYVSSTGILTTTPPTSGILKLIAVGVAVDKILLNGGFELITA